VPEQEPHKEPSFEAVDYAGLDPRDRIGRIDREMASSPAAFILSLARFNRRRFCVLRYPDCYPGRPDTRMCFYGQKEQVVAELEPTRQTLGALGVFALPSKKTRRSPLHDAEVPNQANQEWLPIQQQVETLALVADTRDQVAGLQRIEGTLADVRKAARTEEREAPRLEAERRRQLQDLRRQQELAESLPIPPGGRRRSRVLEAHLASVNRTYRLANDLSGLPPLMLSVPVSVKPILRRPSEEQTRAAKLRAMADQAEQGLFGAGEAQDFAIADIFAYLRFHCGLRAAAAEAEIRTGKIANQCWARGFYMIETGIEPSNRGGGIRGCNAVHAIVQRLAKQVAAT
jgi:hypothetical protein